MNGSSTTRSTPYFFAINVFSSLASILGMPLRVKFPLITNISVESLNITLILLM